MRVRCLSGVLALVSSFAPTYAHEVDPAIAVGADDSYWPGPALSGTWYDPARSGEGFVIEYLPGGDFFITWFTYPAAGEAGEQAWLTMSGGRVDGQRVLFDPVLQTSGGVWGDAFDPTAIARNPWGTLEFEFHDCNTATVRYSGPPAYGSGEHSLTRLTAHDQLDCGGARALTPSGGRALSGLRSKGGAWYVPARSGEGWLLEELSADRMLLYWFTYDPQGRAAWLIGDGARVDNRVEISNLQMTRGTHFGDGFDPAQVERFSWGRIDLTFSDCNGVDVHYASGLPGYGSGTRSAVRLTALGGTACIDGTPAPRTQGHWTEHAAMPAPAQSELDVAVLDGKLYALGGFGDARGFKRYDPASGTWSVLARLPAGRDHLTAFALDGGVYYTGGVPNGDGEQDTSGFRYDVATGQWTAWPELPYTAGSHAAMLNGHIFIGNIRGSLWQYDPRQRISRLIPEPDNTSRDHARVTAFLGEIWVIGGRSPFAETSTVSIYDPVSERWRAGPRVRSPRGGFAASVLDNQIVIGGGEVIHGAYVQPSIEVYAAGTDAWQFGPDLPVPVHGVASGVADGRMYFVSGSTEATSGCCATGRLFSLQFDP
jgi:Kelch motif protein